MKAINPKALKQLRKNRRLSHDKLADKTTIGRRRLIELEKQTAEFHEIRDGNFAALCTALGATPAQLRGEEPITDPMPANYVTLRSKITTVAQMNYDLISAAYGVESDQIVQLAPLMFAILVEDGFEWRRDQLELRKQLLELHEKLRETVYAERVSGPGEISPSDVMRAEELAIYERDVFTAPLEATNALLRHQDVFPEDSFEKFEDLFEHHVTDRFTDFMAAKLKSAPHAFDADIPEIGPLANRDILNPELRYVSVRDLFDYVTEGDDEQTTALHRLALLTGAVRLQDADPEKVSGPTQLQAWFAEQLRDPDTVSRLEEVAPAVSRRELRGPDEAKIMGLDDHGFPVILEQGKKRSLAEAFAAGTGDEGDENDSA